jgi:hypothetical protein
MRLLFLFGALLVAAVTVAQDLTSHTKKIGSDSIRAAGSYAADAEQ